MVKIAPQSNVEIPLLRVLYEALENQLPAHEAIEKVITLYRDDLSTEDLLSETRSGANRWKNRVYWTRQRLVGTGDVESPEKGLWALSDQGKNRVEAEWPDWKPVYTELSEGDGEGPEEQEMPSKGQMVTYFLRAGDHVKVGKTKDDLRRRVGTLQTGNPEEIEILGWVPGDVEKAFHAHFDKFRALGEWFYAVPSIIGFVEDLIDAGWEVNRGNR